MRTSSRGTTREQNTRYGRPGPRSRRQGATPQRGNRPGAALHGDAITVATAAAIGAAGELGERKVG
jgi:hypothetical protein